MIELSTDDQIKVSEFLKFNETIKIKENCNFFETLGEDTFILNKLIDKKTQRWEFRIFMYYSPDNIVQDEETKWFGVLNY